MALGSGSVSFQAGSNIYLLPGFHANANAAGGSFVALIQASGFVSETITTSPTGLPLTIDGVACTSPCNVQWTTGTTHSIGTVSAQSAGAGQQYAFSNWSDGGSLTHNVIAGQATGYTATFVTQYYLITQALYCSLSNGVIQSCPTGGGAISPASGWYSPGSVVGVSASPSSGYQFFFYGGALAGNTSAQNVTVTSPNLTVKAYFGHTPSGGVSPSALEVNLGPIPIEYYDGVTYNNPSNSNLFPNPPCSSSVTVRACLQSILMAYALQGVTGVRFQFRLGGDGQSTGTAFDSVGNVQNVFQSNLNLFFADLYAFGIRNITPTPVTVDSWSGTTTNLWAAYQPDAQAMAATFYQDTCSPTPLQGMAAECAEISQNANGVWGKRLNFFKWLPFGFDPADGGFNDGRIDFQGNSAYYYSPTNPSFWGWSPMTNLVSDIAYYAYHNSLRIEEFDLQNEINVEAFTVSARLIYDNVDGPTNVFDTLGQRLSPYGYSSTALTMSVLSNSGASTTSSCKTLYGVPAQLMFQTQLLAAGGGSLFGYPPYIAPDGEMQCDNSFPSNCASGDWGCAERGMLSLPQAVTTRTVTDTHGTTCVYGGPALCQSGVDITTMSTMFFDAVLEYLQDYGLTGNVVMFGETWANSPNPTCDGEPQQNLAQEMVNGYAASNLRAILSGAVVFRPWEDSVSPACPVPANIGAPSGPYKQ